MLIYQLEEKRKIQSGIRIHIVLACMLFITAFVQLGFCQYSEEDQSDKLRALKTELEEQKKLRDRVIAKRWEDRRLYNESREAFNEQYDELKNKLELRFNEMERIQEELGLVQRDLEEEKIKEEEKKLRFLSLSTLQRTSAQEYQQNLDKRFPVDVPRRQQRFNQVLQSAEQKKENPQEILKEWMTVLKQELDLTRSVSYKTAALVLPDGTPGEGILLNVGTVAAAYLDTTHKQSALMLRTASLSGKLYDWQANVSSNHKEGLELQLKKLGYLTSDVKQMEIPVDVLRTSLAAGGYTRGKSQTLWQSAREYFKAGGIWMWPLYAIGFLASLMLLERFVSWMRSFVRPKIYDKAMDLLEAKDYEALRLLCIKHKSNPIFRLINVVIKNRDKGRESVEKELQEAMLAETPKLERRLTTISVLGAAAPLLGLLGTVSGMIQLFEVITLYGTGDPKLLASGISVALITTETGLIIAIPIMLAHNFISNRMDDLVTQMEAISFKSLNKIWPQA